MLSAPESEQSVLGGLLSRSAEIDEILDLVQPSDFCEPVYKTIFEILKRLHEENKPADLVSVNTEGRGRFDVMVLSDLSAFMVSPSATKHHAKRVKDYAKRRVVAEQGQRLAENAGDQNIETSQLIEQATAALSELVATDSESRAKTASSVVQTIWNETTRKMENPQERSGLPVGYTKLDQILGGWRGEKLYLVAGRPGMGKTAFALNSIYKGGYPSQIFSIEMSASELIERAICFDQHINTLAIRDSRLNEAQFQRFSDGCVSVGASKMMIDDSAVVTVEEIKARSRQAVRKNGAKLIAVDHIGLIKPTNPRQSREQQLSHISWQLKTLAKELKIPVIALAQLNRGVEMREDKRPVMSDLRDSGSLEQDADVIIMLYNAAYYANAKSYKTGVPTITDIIIRKHRGGPLGSVGLKFMPEFTALEDQ